MNRLTERYTNGRINGVTLRALDGFGHIASDDLVLERLAQIEDLMEKYGIESVEELDAKLQCLNKKTEDVETLKQMRKFEAQNHNESYISLFNKCVDEMRDIQHDRDIWKKACELACGILRELNCTSVDNREDCSLETYFYTQAQKEMKDEKR